MSSHTSIYTPEYEFTYSCILVQLYSKNIYMSTYGFIYYIERDLCENHYLDDVPH
jgi:hypothetical protein